MRKIIAICVLSLTFGAFADSYLYWMTADDATLNGTTLGEGSYDRARVGVMNNVTGQNVGYLNLYKADGTSLDSTVAGQTPGDNSAFYASMAGDFGNNVSFYVELLNGATVVGRSVDGELLSYTAASAIATSLGTSQPADLWTSTAFTTKAIPEPNSALLLMLGLSALSLRRKRRVA